MDINPTDITAEGEVGPSSKGQYTANVALLEALEEAGVQCIFANFGSDHPGLIEGLAESRVKGRPLPRVLTCPNEMVAMSAAHGFAQATGRPQAVVVHVECGTQALAGAVHNAAKGRVPIFIYAGASPFTQEGEAKGSRNEFIQWIQDVHDQRGIVRGYMRYDNEIRSSSNVKQLVNRALQFATSDPKGPVYLMGAREVMEAGAPRVVIDRRHWAPVGASALPPQAVLEIGTALLEAKAPLVVTSFIGRKVGAVSELIKLCDRMGIAVLESVPSYVNYPHDHPLYQGNQWNQPSQNKVLGEADVILVIDSDVPWIPLVNRPKAEARIFHIDVDPLKAQMPLWYIGAEQSYRADAQTVLQQLNGFFDDVHLDVGAVERRRAMWAALSAERSEALARLESPQEQLTPEYVTATLRARIDDSTLIYNEGISNYNVIFDHLKLSRPGTMFTSGGGSLGWSGGAALGGKLACPDKTIIALVGDGSFMFSVPSSVFWMSRKYDAPFLTVIYNNGGWKSPKLSALAVHPDGYASEAADLDLSFHPQPDYGGIAAAAGGAHCEVVATCDALGAALDRALAVIRQERRSAVIDVRLPGS